MSGTLEVRRLTSRELEACWQCRLRALEFAPNAFGSTLEEEKVRGPERLKRIFSSDGSTDAVFGAVVSMNVVGMIIISRESGIRASHKASITSMYVDESHRKSGVGGLLVDLAVDYARAELNVKAVFLTVESGNIAAKALYNSRGFKTWGVEPLALQSNGIFYEEDHMVLTL